MKVEHIAIIMDGNGRWAKKRMMPRTFGHREGAKTLDKIVNHSKKLGVKYLTVYAFSTENWKRPQKEVDTLMKLFKEYMEKKGEELKRNKIRFLVSGRRDNISEDLRMAMEKLEEETKDQGEFTLNIAFNYGGRQEIVDGINKAIKEGVEKVDEETFGNYLYNDLPDPELVIRTSGEIRISNFLLWQIAYSEIYISDKYWPEFTVEDYEEAIRSFEKRDRRLGGVVDVK